MDGWADVPVVVTGASGFIGRRLCARLQALGARVTAVARSASPGAGVAADVTDVAATRRLFEAVGPARVFHLAARLDRETGLDALAEHVRVNVLGTASVLAASAAVGVTKVVTAATAEECGATPPAPILDDTPAEPCTPYGISKAMATQLGLDAWRLARLPVTVARLFLVYGPGMSPRFFLRQLLDATRDGRTLDMTEGRQTRDFTHVDDVVEGLLAASASPHLDGRVVNLCTGVERSLREVCEIWERITGRTGVARLGACPYRVTEVFRCFGAPGALRDTAGWTARISLEDGLRSLWESADPR